MHLWQTLKSRFIQHCGKHSESDRLLIKDVSMMIKDVYLFSILGRMMKEIVKIKSKMMP